MVVELIQDHFSLHRGKQCKSDHGTWGPHMSIFRFVLPIIMVQRVFLGVGEAKEGFFCYKCQRTMAEKWRFKFVDWYFLYIYIYFGQEFYIVRRKEGKNKGRRSNMKKISKICPFWTSINKISISTFWWMSTSLGPHLVHT